MSSCNYGTSWSPGFREVSFSTFGPKTAAMEYSRERPNAAQRGEPVVNVAGLELKDLSLQVLEHVRSVERVKVETCGGYPGGASAEVKPF